jgi:sulfate permease, SulP family
MRWKSLKRAADEIGTRLVLVHLAREIEDAFRTSRFIDGEIVLAPDLDHALENCENGIIAAHRGGNSETHTLTDWLAVALRSSAHAEQLVQLCQRREVVSGETISRQGEAADCIYFILDGRVGIIVEMGDEASIRVRSLGPHTTIGEMSLITRQPRSATIQAEVDSVLYALTIEAYERITRDNPALALAVLTYIICVMSERLSFANRVITALQRWRGSRTAEKAWNTTDCIVRWSGLFRRTAHPGKQYSALA